MAADVAAALLTGGVPESEVYASTAYDTLLDLTTEGQLREALGRPRRRWAGYTDQAQQRAAKWGREYAAFCEASGITDVIQVVVRAPAPLVPINGLRAAHARQSGQLGDRLRYGRQRFARGFTWDIIAAEIRNADRESDVLDLHFHLAVRSSRAALIAMRANFLRRGWSWWDAVTASEPHHHREPGALASYVAKGLAHALRQNAGLGHGFSNADLTELYRQTRGLSLVRSTGGFRAWKAGLERDGLTVAEDRHGRLVVRPRRPVLSAPRFRKKLLAGSSAQLLRLCVHDFGDGTKRPAMLVRGREGITFAEMAAEYDMSDALASAQRALAFALRNASKPESDGYLSGLNGRFEAAQGKLQFFTGDSPIKEQHPTGHFRAADAYHRSLTGDFITCN